MELFRFDRLREHQEQAISDIYNAISQKKSILMSAPTGLGKTDAAISAALRHALESNLNVFFLTPKISQHKIAAEAMQGINEKFGLGIKFADIVGKRNMCTNPDANSIESEAFYKECEKLVKNGKCGFFSAFKQSVNALPNEIIDSANKGHNAVIGACFDYGMCAYEAATHLAKESRVVIADYSHILNPSIRSAFLKRIAHKLNDSIIIWDEAHNIIDLASKYTSINLTTNTIASADKELEKIGSKVDLGYLQFALEKLALKKLYNIREAFVSQEDMPEEINGNVDSISKALNEQGLEYIEKSKAKRSSILHVARFIEAWKNSDESFVRIISKEAKNIRLSIISLYPESIASTFNEAYANIFMSATLTPLSMYKELFGLKDAAAKQYGASFPVSNKLVFIDDSITTKYESRSIQEYKKIAQRISEIKKVIPGNIAVFYPSFELLNNVVRYMNNESIYIQRRSMGSIELESTLESFKKSSDSMLFGVMGGSMSEGVDYKGNVLKGIVIVGVPLAKPSLEINARIEYYNKRFNGKGVEYAYITPAVIKGVQAAGRAIRSETDKAVIVFMDKRYRWRIYNPVMGSDTIKESSNYINAIRDFWSKAQISVRPK
jgi:DNA excision repair protein ERCC-2